MTIVFAWQAPTLLNRLAASSVWELRTMDLGDAADLAELRWLDTLPFTGNPYAVEFVAVCTPHQWLRAGNLFPRAKRVWVLHNGHESMTPREGTYALCFSHKVARLHTDRNPALRIGVVVPSYTPEFRWQAWAPRIWTLLNRPTSDRAEYLGRIQRLAEGYSLEAYGQGWPLGVLEGAARAELDRACAAYLTPLPPWAGFGLAQHECLARGVPIVGSRWGDFDQELPEYSSLSDSYGDQRTALQRLLDPAEGPFYAAQLSELGRRFILQHRSQITMDESIRRVLTLWS